ncbi:GNAT family N-acetyltransferase [Dyadobacter sp. CY345]|uniref:GNAT family N-acetyltransferase n=1 Tax=Dyadobacter sp. CY345 TaxID=2909335 RepID=UPI001F4667FB|nr:GNAT family N-acetyltransferase [Dyadobacter sp. CY345]MCF2443015.1 GNAT family N-acetyltransferase [Dyadobacter sp. CY345]
MQHSIIIRQASIADLKTVQMIAKETFFETFAEANTEADMQMYLDKNFGENAMKEELDNPYSLFYIAREGEIPVGYLKVNLNEAQTELKDESSLEIERIYVKRAYHGKKVGQILYEKAVDTAMFYKKKYLWLGVWEENQKAIKFYQKNGFVAFDKHIFKFGGDEQIDIMMKKSL